MIGDVYIPPDSDLRDGAARLLHAHVSKIAAVSKANGIPLLVCLPAANERGLAPLGESRLDDFSPAEQKSIRDQMSQAASQLKDAPEKARETVARRAAESPATRPGKLPIGKMRGNPGQCRQGVDPLPCGDRLGHDALAATYSLGGSNPACGGGKRRAGMRCPGPLPPGRFRSGDRMGLDGRSRSLLAKRPV